MKISKILIYSIAISFLTSCGLSNMASKFETVSVNVTPPSNEIRKSALGSTNSVEWIYKKETEEAINQLKQEGYHIVGVEQVENSSKLDNFKIKEPIALIFGHEVDGICQKIIDKCDDVIEIEQFGTKHSLNISVCAGIVIWKSTQLLK